jgi:peptidoglycan hydrolase CwlO-like protein
MSEDDGIMLDFETVVLNSLRDLKKESGTLRDEVGEIRRQGGNDNDTEKRLQKLEAQIAQLTKLLGKTGTNEEEAEEEEEETGKEPEDADEREKIGRDIEKSLQDHDPHTGWRTLCYNMARLQEFNKAHRRR